MKPNTEIKVGFFIRLRVTFPLPGKAKTGALRHFEVVIFHQKYNPQTSVGSMFSSLKISSLSDLSGLLSQKGIAVIAFFLIFFVFVLNTSLCPGDPKGSKNPQMIEEKLIPGEEELPKNEGMIETMCRMKSSLTANFAVAFIVLTVVRQVMIRIQKTRDRI